MKLKMFLIIGLCLSLAGPALAQSEAAVSAGVESVQDNKEKISNILADYASMQRDALNNLKSSLEKELVSDELSQAAKDEMLKQLELELTLYRKEYKQELSGIKEDVAKKYDQQIIGTKQELVTKLNTVIDDLLGTLSKEVGHYKEGIKTAQSEIKEDLLRDLEFKLADLRNSLNRTIEGYLDSERQKIAEASQEFKRSILNELQAGQETERIKEELAKKMDKQLKPFFNQYSKEINRIKSEINSKHRQQLEKIKADADRALLVRKEVLEKEKDDFRRELLNMVGRDPSAKTSQASLVPSESMPTQIVPRQGYSASDFETKQLSPEYNQFRKPISLLEAVPVTLETALSKISRLVKIDLSIKEDVKKDILVKPQIKNRPVYKALNELLYPLGYAFRLNRQTLSVYRFERRQFNIVKGPASYQHKTIVSSQSQLDHGDSASTNQEIKMGASTYVESSIEIDFWKELEANLTKMISSSGWFTLNKSEGIAVAHDTPSVLDEIERYLDSLNRQASKQVFVQARILEVGLSDANAWGIDWDAVYAKVSGTARGITGSIGVIENIVDNPTVSLGAYEARSGNVASRDFRGLLAALATQGKVDVMSQPKLLLLNNIPAKIQVVKKIPYISEVKKSVSSSAGADVTYEVSTSEVLQGVILELSARIIDKDNIYINLTPIVKDITSTVIPEKTFQNITIQLPQTTDRAITTTIKVRSGETIIIGGLIQENEKENIRKVPILGDIPLLGWLFKSRSKVKEKTEVVIMLTPEMVI